MSDEYSYFIRWPKNLFQEDRCHNTNVEILATKFNSQMQCHVTTRALFVRREQSGRKDHVDMSALIDEVILRVNLSCILCSILRCRLSFFWQMKAKRHKLEQSESFISQWEWQNKQRLQLMWKIHVSEPGLFQKTGEIFLYLKGSRYGKKIFLAVVVKFVCSLSISIHWVVKSEVFLFSDRFSKPQIFP